MEIRLTPEADDSWAERWDRRLTRRQCRWLVRRERRAAEQAERLAVLEAEQAACDDLGRAREVAREIHAFEAALEAAGWMN